MIHVHCWLLEKKLKYGWLLSELNSPHCGVPRGTADILLVKFIVAAGPQQTSNNPTGDIHTKHKRTQKSSISSGNTRASDSRTKTNLSYCILCAFGDSQKCRQIRWHRLRSTLNSIAIHSALCGHRFLCWHGCFHLSVTWVLLYQTVSFVILPVHIVWQRITWPSAIPPDTCGWTKEKWRAASTSGTRVSPKHRSPTAHECTICVGTIAIRMWVWHSATWTTAARCDGIWWDWPVGCSSVAATSALAVWSRRGCRLYVWHRWRLCYSWLENER